MHRMSNALALLGGSPVRTQPFPTWPVYGKEEEQALLRTLHSGKWGKIDGGEVKAFEERFAEYCGAKHGIAVVNGTVSLRIALMAAGVVTFGAGSGLYIGAGLGPGPRDGLMTGLAARTGYSIRLVRTVLELAVLLGGWALGGTPGIGTAVFAVTIGPIVQFFLHRFGMWSGTVVTVQGDVAEIADIAPA